MMVHALWLVLVSAVDAHYAFKGLVVGGKSTGDWVNVRKTDQGLISSPVTDITSAEMTCYTATNKAKAKTAAVAAGSTVGFTVDPAIFHNGPASFWMAKAPTGQTADTMTGEGPVWFKIQQDYPDTKGAWPASGKSVVNVVIPMCIPNGDYLLRVEHMALELASSKQAPMWMSCAQITVSGATGSSLPSDLVSIPGAYKAGDPGITTDGSKTGGFKPAGPEPLKC